MGSSTVCFTRDMRHEIVGNDLDHAILSVMSPGGCSAPHHVDALLVGTIQDALLRDDRHHLTLNEHQRPRHANVDNLRLGTYPSISSTFGDTLPKCHLETKNLWHRDIDDRLVGTSQHGLL